MKHRILFSALFLFALSMSLASCDSEDPTPNDPRAEITQSIAENVIIPIYHDLEERGNDLLTAINALTVNPPQSAIDAARAAWVAARTPFEMGEAFEFGPLEEMGFKDEIDAWPVRPEALDSLFATSFVVNEANVKLLNVNLRGYHMIEFYLWGDTAFNIMPRLSTQKDIDYLKIVTKLMVDQFTELHHEWDAAGGNYVKNFKEFDDNRTVAAALEEIRFGMDHIADELGEEYLIDPYNKGPRFAESYFSDKSTNDFTAILDGIYAVYHGDYGGNNNKGFTDFVQTIRTSLDDSIKTMITDTRAKIVAVGPSYNTAAALKDPKILAAVAAAEALHRIFENEVKPHIQ